MRWTSLVPFACVLASVTVACGDEHESAPVDPPSASPIFEGTFGPEGGELIASPGSGFEGFALRIPAGALTETVQVRFVGVSDDAPLPETAERVGPQVQIEPAGIVLAQPAELTLPLDLALLGSYEGRPEDCKAWIRKSDGWEKREAVQHGQTTVSVAIDRFAAVAAGINFTPQTTCKTCPTVVEVPTAEECEVKTEAYCLVALPRPTPQSYLDDFASVTVQDRNVYWVGKVDGNPTVYRYNLDAPGEAFTYPAFTGASSGTIASRGQVAVVSTSEVWAGVQGYGNLRFRPDRTTTAFDAPPAQQPVGVVAKSGGNVQRFFRRTTSSAFEVHRAAGTGSETKFVYKYAVFVPGTNNSEINPPDDLTGVASDDDFASVRSLHRGLGFTSKPNLAVLASGFWGVEFFVDKPNGVDLDNDTKTYGGGSYLRTELQQNRITMAAGRSEGNPVTLFGFGFETTVHDVYSTENVTFPSPVRDIASFDGSELAGIAAAKNEVYLYRLDTLATETFALPELSTHKPLRIRAVNATDYLVITRGPLAAKGQFYLLKRR